MTIHRDLLAQRTAAEDRLHHLAAQIETLRHDRSGEYADDEHDPEGVTLSSEWSRLVGLHANTEAELVHIDAALARVQAGIYGVCVTCGSGIPAERLEARATAAECIPCASR